MLRQTLVAPGALSLANRKNVSVQPIRPYASQPKPTQVSEMQSWLKRLNEDNQLVPSKIVHMSQASGSRNACVPATISKAAMFPKITVGKQE